MIYVDADACPVKAEVERVGTRHKLKMFVVSNGVSVRRRTRW